MRSLIIVLLAFACGSSAKVQYDPFGDEITQEEALDTKSFLQAVTDESQSFKVKGTIEKVCQMKGCWMTLQNESGANIRVTFRDYGFFVPKDINGKEVVIEGEAFKEVLDEEVAQHYADDEGKEYDDSMRYTISFVAHGVLVAKS